MPPTRRSPLAALALALGAAALGPAPAAATPLAPGSLAAAARQAGLDFGAAVDTGLDAARRALAAREFTSATIENSLKWQPLSPAPGVYDFAAADAAVAFAEQSGLRVRGHTLFWDRGNGRPTWLAADLAAAADPAAQLTARMQTHAATVVGRYAGRLAQWDVVNEPLKLGSGRLDPDNLYVQTLGEPYLDIAFHAARAADPTALLFLNETLTEAPPVFDGLLLLVERLLARGVPIDGVGLQGHYQLVPPDRTALQAQLQRIADLGLLVEITELDLPLFLFTNQPDPLAAQARAYADVILACRAVSACTGITTWGLDDGDSWLDTFPQTAPFAPNRALLFDEMLGQKPAYGAAVGALLGVPEPGMGTLLGIALVGAVVIPRLQRS